MCWLKMERREVRFEGEYAEWIDTNTGRIMAKNWNEQHEISGYLIHRLDFESSTYWIHYRWANPLDNTSFLCERKREWKYLSPLYRSYAHNNTLVNKYGDCALLQRQLLRLQCASWSRTNTSVGASTTDFILDRLIREDDYVRWTAEYLKESSCDLFQDTIRYLHGRSEENKEQSYRE